MIKVEDSKVWIETSEGIPGVMTDLTMALRAVRDTAKNDGLSESEAELLINQCVRLSKASTEEIEREADTMSILEMLFGGADGSGSVEKDE